MVSTARMRVVDRDLPIYTYRDAGGVDEWTVARRALGQGGSRWLPVRYPALYAGDVFRTLVRDGGLVLAPPRDLASLPDGATELARIESADLQGLMRGMLRFSTNLTAEVAGLSGTAALTGQRRGLRTSALGMSRWVEDRAGVASRFVDHSGLGDESRISPAAMVGLLQAPGVRDTLLPVLKRIAMTNEQGDAIAGHPAEVRAKTGTLNFVSTLAGYLTTGSGRQLGFAIFAADLDRREASRARGEESPDGASGFNARARRLQQRLLQRWALMY